MSGNSAVPMPSTVNWSSPAGQWELARRLPAPRPVRAREITCWFYSALALCLLIPLLFFGYLAWQGLAREWFHFRGVRTTGRVVDCKFVQHSNAWWDKSTRVDYIFEVDGRTYRFQTVRDGHHSIDLGNAEVIYPAGDPDGATSVEHLEIPWWDTGWLRWLPVLPVVIFLGTLPCIFSLRAWRRRRLMMHGVVGEATVENVKPASRGPYTHVSYVFQVDGRPHYGIVPVLTGTDQIQRGQKLGMLYDLREPKVNDLFFLAFGSYQIVAPAVSHIPDAAAG